MSNEHHDLSHSTLPQIEETLRSLSVSNPVESAQNAAKEVAVRTNSTLDPREERDGSNVGSAENVVPPSISSSANESKKLQMKKGKDEFENLSTSSSVESEWIEVDQPDGKFYFNKFTKEVRKELPPGM